MMNEVSFVRHENDSSNISVSIPQSKHGDCTMFAAQTTHVLAVAGAAPRELANLCFDDV